jgi:hypothetical protein
MKRYLALLVAAACGSDPAQIAGTYTVELTNGADGCNYGSTPGQQTSGVQVVFTQSGTSVTATVNGAAGGLLGLAIGSNIFMGAIDGDALDLTITGTTPHSTGNCAFTRNAAIVASYANNSINGVVNYTNADNHNSDCLEGCVSVQNFAGSRPPP